MSTTVTYKGNIIATVNNASATLETEGKYLEAKILLTDQTTPVLQTKSVTPTESAQTITPDVGYDGLGEVDVAAISSTYVGTGVSRQAAQTIYPSSSDQSIAANKYLTGAQTIKGVTTTNLSADNIKKDVVVQVGDSADPDRVVSVTGTYEGGGGGGSSNIVAGSFTTPSTGTTSVTLPYSGSGHPIALQFYLSGGTTNNTILQNAVICGSAVSQDFSVFGTTYRYSVEVFYKNSSSNAGSAAVRGTVGGLIVKSTLPTGANESNIVAIAPDGKTLKFRIKAGSVTYGLLPEEDYDYVVVYSS